MNVSEIIELYGISKDLELNLTRRHKYVKKQKSEITSNNSFLR